jgi:hypothetical protein
MKGPANSTRDVNCPPHEPSGWECLVGHGDGKGQCPQCKKCGRFYRPGEESKPIEVTLCDSCGKNEANQYSNPDYSPKHPGWTCEKCRSSVNV